MKGPREGCARVEPPRVPVRDIAAVFWDLVEESLDEAEFFWARHDAGLDPPDQTLGEV